MFTLSVGKFEGVFHGTIVMKEVLPGKVTIITDAEVVECNGMLSLKPTLQSNSTYFDIPYQGRFLALAQPEADEDWCYLCDRPKNDCACHLDDCRCVQRAADDVDSRECEQHRSEYNGAPRRR